MERTDTISRAVELLHQRPPLSFAVIGRNLGVTREWIRQISEKCGEGNARRRELAVARRLESLQRQKKISRSVLQTVTSELQPEELKELSKNLGRRTQRTGV